MNTTILKIRSVFCSICLVSCVIYKKYTNSMTDKQDEDIITALQQNTDSENMNVLFLKEADKSLTKYFLYIGDRRVKYKEAMRYLATEEKFRTRLTETLQNSSFSAFFFETPPVNIETYDETDFEFVLVYSKALSEKQPDPEAFNEHFLQPGKLNVAFENLGKDAILVAPCPSGGDNSVYTHLAVFLRSAPEEQIDDFWKTVGIEMSKRVVSKHKKPTWLSTSGLGIYWLHMRLDSKPKYYTYSEYKKFQN